MTKSSEYPELNLYTYTELSTARKLPPVDHPVRQALHSQAFRHESPALEEEHDPPAYRLLGGDLVLRRDEALSFPAENMFLFDDADEEDSSSLRTNFLCFAS